VLRGEAEILITEGPDPNRARVEQLPAGSFVYYPAYQYHTIRITSASPLTYLMYKWQLAPADVGDPMHCSDATDLNASAVRRAHAIS
jgi:hypothetical protein